MAAAYVLRGPDVVHDTIDGETVIVDMENGAYYRLDGAAAVAWQALDVAAGAGAESVAGHLVARYDVAPAEAVQRAQEFLAQIAAFGLIVPGAGDAAAAAVPPPAAAAARVPFPGLAIHRFTDLEELLFLDPVHEVDETGWPQQPAPR